MKSLVKPLLLVAVFAACKNQPAPPPPPPAAPDAAAILKHKYWVSKPYYDALFAPNIVDTISYLPCGELIFGKTDTVLLTACLSDTGMGTFKATSPTTMDVVYAGFEDKPCKASLDEKTGILHLDAPAGVDNSWPTEFIAQDDIDVSNLDYVTINLGRKRLAGTYSILPKKGEVAIASMVELHADGTHLGFGDFDTYEPWPAGIGGGAIQTPPMNVMFLVKKGKESDPVAVGWQVHGDTLRLWDTKSTSAEGDMPEYKIAKVRGTYLKQK